MAAPEPHTRQRNGTGNKFGGTEADSNILKLFRMLDRSDATMYTFYQPGIGTYITSNSMQTTSAVGRVHSWYKKAKDSAVGSSFADHVMGAYKYLMRYYCCEDDLYFFGFSRGAYTARFLADMLDHIGLLGAGNEELVRFAWKTYAKWAARTNDGTDKAQRNEDEQYKFMRGFRETFCRPVRRIRFLGLFDTVNSVPRFEGAWMQRSKFPYTARPSAKVIRHAVSIDERRAKFRQDLLAGSRHKKEGQVDGKANGCGGHRQSIEPGSLTSSTYDVSTDKPGSQKPMRHRRRRYSGTDQAQDVSEVWFAGGHADIGGGWKRCQGETWPLSHAPLVWMIHEAERAGLNFDETPLPMGEPRDIPQNAQIHYSAIERMRNVPNYRPGNLIIGGGGRAVLTAPAKCGIGNWKVREWPGDPIKETFVRKLSPDDSSSG
ncbi:uncharacterized protein A1O9_02639 [Exophiala aquamarina CBS 119918]|uniref:T6SS Phospholipase effector Tle1-like catalytic domain-containing protein n=1 Tax=Exophiala aquamarina CBS 119918 TaxID=1182545 RepID=A0A072PLT7_9EURO|nr:uncharacterized protein A1O9_02639 [Exophiala aquamarina CBS 119918]KEF61074.1 hypothetical protein A1O9_02639 [Exophiala aquamarina CBS 119918]